MMTWWEEGNLDIVAYLCFASSLPKMKSRKRAVQSSDQLALFADSGAVAEQEAVETGERVYYVLRLPYTREALERRRMYGRDVPEWFIQKEKEQ